MLKLVFPRKTVSARTIAFGCLLVLTLATQQGTARKRLHSDYLYHFRIHFDCIESTLVTVNSPVLATPAVNGSVTTPLPAGNASNVTVAPNSTAVLPTAHATTASVATRTCALCTSQNADECTINSTYTGSNISTIVCPAISYCFTKVYVDNTSEIAFILRGCESLPSQGSYCGNITASGSLSTYCSCYCDRTNCNAITNSCSSHSVLLLSFIL